MKERMDSVPEGYRTGGIHESRDSGLQGYGKDGMQEKEGRRK